MHLVGVFLHKSFVFSSFTSERIHVVGVFAALRTALGFRGAVVCRADKVFQLHQVYGVTARFLLGLWLIWGFIVHRGTDKIVLETDKSSTLTLRWAPLAWAASGMLQLLVWSATQGCMLAAWLVSMIALITCYLAAAALRLAPMIVLTMVTTRLLVLSASGYVMRHHLQVREAGKDAVKL